MKQYWQNLQERERRLVIAGAVVLALLLLYAAVWSPFQDHVRSTRERVAAQQETLAWMQQAAAEINRLRGRTPSARPTGASLLTVTDQVARAQGLTEALQRVQPDGQKGVRVWLEGAAFDSVLRWLDTLVARHGVTVSSFTVEAGAAPGQVNARIVLEEAA